MSEGATWLILGASSPIARAFARRLAKPDAHIILAGRDTDDMERTAADLRISSGASVEVAKFDALDFASHADAASRWGNREGPLNVILLFGLMPEQTVIDQDPSLLIGCVESTYTGAI